jgi:hypothetical protein
MGFTVNMQGDFGIFTSNVSILKRKKIKVFILPVEKA